MDVKRHEIQQLYFQIYLSIYYYEPKNTDHHENELHKTKSSKWNNGQSKIFYVAYSFCFPFCIV